MATPDGGSGRVRGWRPRGRRVAAAALLATPIALLVVQSVAACSGPATTLANVRRAATLIVLGQVVREHDDGASYTVVVEKVARGGVAPGAAIRVGSSATSPAGFPDCWLTLPVGKRVVLALTDSANLYALTSYGWWEDNGHASSQSPVETWPDSLDAVFRELSDTGPPATDAHPPATAPPDKRLAPAAAVAVAVAAAATAVVLRRRWNRA